MITQVTAAYSDIHTWDNLYFAYRRAAKGKRGRIAAAAFEYRLEERRLKKGCVSVFRTNLQRGRLEIEFQANS